MLRKRKNTKEKEAEAKQTLEENLESAAAVLDAADIEAVHAVIKQSRDILERAR